jgi:hypothetical protein
VSDVDVRVMAVMIVGAVAVVAGLPSRLHTGPGLHVFVDIRRLSSTAPHHLTVTLLNVVLAIVLVVLAIKQRHVLAIQAHGRLLFLMRIPVEDSGTLVKVRHFTILLTCILNGLEGGGTCKRG